MMKNKKILSFLMATVVAMSAFPTTVWAAGSSASAESDANVAAGSAADTVQGQDTEQHKQSAYGTADAEEESEQSFDVYATKDSVSEVLLPKTVILNGAKAKSNDGYYVAGVKGDIAGDKQINIVPDSAVTLSAAGQNDVTAEITQEKTGFIYADGINPDNWTLTTGKISANIAAGIWNGQAQFNVSCSNYYGKKIKQWDVSANKDAGDDVKMTYYDPSQIVITPEGKKTVKASISSLFAPMTAYAADTPGLTDIETYTDGTVVITGKGKMKDSVFEYWYDTDTMAADMMNYLRTTYGSKSPEDFFGSRDNPTQEALDNIGKFLADFSESAELASTFTVSSVGNYPTFKVKNTRGWKFYQVNTWVTPVTDSEGYVNVTCWGNIKEPAIEPYRTHDALVQMSMAAQQWSNKNLAHYNIFQPIDVIIQDGVTSIGASAFKGCSSIQSVTFSDSVVQIGNEAFMQCTGLKDVALPSQLKSLGIRAFGSSGLEHIELPSTIKSFGGGVFRNCTALKSVVLQEGITEIGSDAFYNCTALTQVTVPKSITKIGNTAFMELAAGSIIYCQTQAVADLLKNKYQPTNTTVVVDATKFN